MPEKIFNLSQSAEDHQKPAAISSDVSGIDLRKLAEEILEKLRRELEIENERTGRS